MIPPEDRNEMLTGYLRDTLSIYARMRRTLVREMQDRGACPPLKYASAEEMVLFVGRPKATRITECRFPPMRAGNCFGNAFELTLDDPTLTYVEGWACMEQSYPTHHGWVEDTNGNIHDPTWLTIVQEQRANPRTRFMYGYAARCVYWGVRVPRRQHLAWFHKHDTPNVLSFGDMTPREILHEGMDALSDISSNEAEDIRQAKHALATTPQWRLNGAGTGHERTNLGGTLTEWYP